MMYEDDEQDFYEGVPWSDGVDWGFADPGGNSALRAATHDTCPRCKKSVDEIDAYCRHCGQMLNPRTESCGRCGDQGVLTPADKRRGYVCDPCADAAERGYDRDY